MKLIVSMSCFAVAVVLHASPAAGQDSKPLAEALFQEGKQLVATGDHKTACEKFEASNKLDPSVGALIQLGRCNEKQGKTASAWSSFMSAQSLAVKLGDKARAAPARAEADRLAETLTQITVKRAPGSETQGLEIKLNGQKFPLSGLGQPLPVDPGEQVVTVSAEGFEPWQTNVTANQPKQTVTVEIPALEPIEKPGEPDPRPDIQPDLEPDRTPPNLGLVEADPGRGRRSMAYGIGVGGVAVTATGFLFGALAKSKYDSRTDNNECDADNVCSDAGLETIDSANNRALIASILVPVGLVAIGAAALLHVTAPDRAPGSARAVGPVVGPDHLGVSVGGTF